MLYYLIISLKLYGIYNPGVFNFDSHHDITPNSYNFHKV